MTNTITNQPSVTKVPQFGCVTASDTISLDGYVCVAQDAKRRIYAKADDASLAKLWLGMFNVFLPDWNFFLHPRPSCDVIVVNES